MAALDDVVKFAHHTGNAWNFSKIIAKSAAVLGKAARPVALAVLDAKFPHHTPDQALPPLLQGLTLLVEWKDPADDAVIEKHLLRNPYPEFIRLARRWKPERIEEPLWKLMEDKSRPVRAAAAQTLASLGDSAVTRAAGLLAAKKSDTRSAAVMLLGSASTDAAITLLEERLDSEPDDDVRDQILQVLERVWTARGRTISREQIAERVAKAKPKLAEAPARWLDIAKLPPLHLTDGTRLDRDTVRYLVYRQSRAKEMQADIEARPLYDLIDRGSSGDFAWQVLKAFLSSGAKIEAADRWALALAGLLGDDRVVLPINVQIREWVDKGRGKLAEYAVRALALIGSDAALCVVDGLSLRYRNKQKNVGQAAAEAFVDAAETLGISPDELGDRVVPWLGFEPGRPRLLGTGKAQIEVRIGPDFKFHYRDLATGKPLSSLPSRVSAADKAEFKELAAMLREVVKGQVARLENLMVRQFRWPVDRWRELFLQHPVLLPFSLRLVWGFYQGTKLKQCFRTLEDLTFTDETDSPVNLPPECEIGIVHPLELDEPVRKAWQTHVADYDIEPPFAQMERPVIRPADDEQGTRISKAMSGTTLNAMTFKGRAEKLGWRRGSVVDNGTVPNYAKTFPGAGTDAFLSLDGMYMGIDAESVVHLESHFLHAQWNRPDRGLLVRRTLQGI